MTLPLVITLAGEPASGLPFGVAYKITNLVTGAAYIGITRQAASRRFRAHVRASVREESVLYRAMRKYGLPAFSMTVLAEAFSAKELSVLERALIAEHGTYLTCGGYNMTSGGEGSQDVCELTREAMRRAASARMADPALRARIAESLRGAKPTAEALRRRIEARLGVPLSDAHRQAISARHLGKVIPPEQRAKIAAALRGRSPSPETRARLSAALRGRPVSPETREKIAAAQRGRVFTEEHKAKIREAKRRKRGEARS